MNEECLICQAPLEYLEHETPEFRRVRAEIRDRFRNFVQSIKEMK